MGRAATVLARYEPPGTSRVASTEMGMRRGCVPLAALLLAGCGQEDVEACEEFLKGGLRSPATHRQVSVRTYNAPITKQQATAIGARVYDDRPLTLRKVFIDYDADNAFGTPVRGIEMCAFLLSDGKLPDAGSLRSKVSLAGTQRDYRRLTGQQEPDYPCCL